MTEPSPAGGKVYLVGAGPGDPELLTVKAFRLLQEADVVLYDSLIQDELIEALPDGLERIDVGKRPEPGGTRTTQKEINDLLIERASEGRTVVRLKGGDPTVFGRGGEEAEQLANAGIPFEIVPGVTSVVGAPNVAGIPLTHREHASSVAIVTGHESPEKDESALDWNALAEVITAGGTLVILMGVGGLARNVNRLRTQGLEAETPIALIEKATWPDERTVTGTLETIVDRADRAGIEPPAITVVGNVVAVRDRLEGWLAREDRREVSFEAGPPDSRPIEPVRLPPSP